MGFRGGRKAAEQITAWDSWLRRVSLKAFGRAFGKRSSLFIAIWPLALRRPVEPAGAKPTLAEHTKRRE